MKQARKVRHSKPGRPNPVAEFAATGKAYLPAFRHNNRHNLSESPSKTASAVGHPQIFQADFDPIVGAGLDAMAA
jgi:hypothetical protein